MAHYVVGDVQGCLAPLECLLQQVNFDPLSDTLWSVGDLVNRGPDSLGVLRLFQQLGDSAKVVLGNHDLHLLAIAHGSKKLKKSDTLGPILDAPDRQLLLDWLIRQPLLIHDPALNIAVVHAGIPPGWSIGKAVALASEVSEALQSDPHSFFAHMYGNTPECWDDELQGPERLRTITNYLTRMRFCQADGTLDLTTKDSKQHHDPRYLPWFAHPRASVGEPRILFGHWAALEGDIISPQAVALDTGCVWGRSLRLIRLEDQQLFECDCAHLNH